MVSSSPSSELYPTNIFYDPLLLPQWHGISNLEVIRTLVDGNFLFKSYIKTLDDEIAFDLDIPKYKALVNSLLDALRTYGWCVLSTYLDGDYRVHSPFLRTQWLTKEENGTIKRIGCEFTYTDDIGNATTEKTYFEDQFDENGFVSAFKSYFFVWKKGDGQIKSYLNQDTVFALGDMDLATLTAGIGVHQIKGTMEISAVKPFFLFFRYGESATSTQTALVKQQLGYVGPNAGFGAKFTVVDAIDQIPNADIPSSVEAMDDLTSIFANITRLPMSFYKGERSNGGLGDTGETADELKILRRKKQLLAHLIEICGPVLQEEFQLTLTDAVYEQQEQELNAKHQNNNRVANESTEEDEIDVANT